MRGRCTRLVALVSRGTEWQSSVGSCWREAQESAGLHLAALRRGQGLVQVFREAQEGTETN